MNISSAAPANPSNRRSGDVNDQTDSEALFGSNGRIYTGWLTTLASMTGLTFGATTILVFCFATFAPHLEKEFRWGIKAISFGATIITVTIIISSLLSGVLIDRFGARKLVLWSTPVFGLAVAAMSLVSSDIRFFYAGLALAGLAGIGVWPNAYNKATANWFDRRLGFSLGLANAGIGIGAAILPPLAAAIIAAYGWRNAYIALGAIAVLIPWTMSFFMLKEKAPVAGATRGIDALVASGLSFAESSKKREFALIMLGFFTLGAASSAFVVHQVRILMDTGLTQPQAIVMQTVLGIALIFGRVCTGWLLDRFKATTLMLLFCLAATGAMLLLSVGAPYGTAPLCAAIMGFVIGAEFDVLGYLIPRYFGRKSFGAIYGSIYAVFQVAAAISVALMGISRADFGSYTTGLYVVAALLVVGAACFAGIGAYRFAPQSLDH
jgi:MFS family permease